MTNSKLIWLPVAIIVILTVALIGTLLYLKNQAPEVRGVPPIREISKMDPDSSNWGINFPNQYSTFLKTETNNTRTAFGGSERYGCNCMGYDNAI